MAEMKFEESVDANEYVALEKFNSITYGFIVGWLSGWVVAGVGYSINERRKYLQPASA
jgi:hypothetical protein